VCVFPIPLILLSFFLLSSSSCAGSWKKSAGNTIQRKITHAQARTHKNMHPLPFTHLQLEAKELPNEAAESTQVPQVLSSEFACLRD
jgi:hypothetical protein